MTWFLERQVRIALTLGLVCILLVDSRWPSAILAFCVSLPLILAGQRLFEVPDSTNWMRFSYAEILKNILGGVLTFFGWMIFLRLLLALAIGAILLRVG